MKNKFLSPTAVIILITGLLLTVFTAVFSGKDMDSTDGKIIDSCVITHNDEVNGGYSWYDIRHSEDDSSALITISSSDSLKSPDFTQHYQASDFVFNELKITLDSYNMQKWSTLNLSDEKDKTEESNSLLIRYSDGSTLYLSAQELRPQYQEGFDALKKCIDSYSKNDNSHLSIKKITNNDDFVETPHSLNLRTEFFSNGYLTVYVTNQSGVDTEFSTDFTLSKISGSSKRELEKAENAEEAEVITYPINDMFIIRHVLDLNVYGKLEPGHYELNMDGMTTEFFLK